MCAVGEEALHVCVQWGGGQGALCVLRRDCLMDGWGAAVFLSACPSILLLPSFLRLRFCGPRLPSALARLALAGPLHVRCGFVDISGNNWMLTSFVLVTQSAALL